MVIRSLRRKPDLSLQRGRTLFLLVAVVLWSGAIVARLVHLQVIQHDWYVRIAHTQQTAVIKLPAQRGDIFARGGQTLATSVELASIYAHPAQVEDPLVAASLLAPVLGRSVQSLYAELNTKRRFVYLRRKASPQIESAVRKVVREAGLRGIGLHPDAKRYYPQRSLAAHATGFVNVDNLGQSGVELFYDELIRGEPGSFNTLKDGHKRVIGIRSWALENPTRGHDLTLTIDWTLQFAAEGAIERAVHARGAKGGSIVAMDPYSGEILAMASYPTFNPNVRNDEAFRLHRLNQVIHSTFEPGSAFKVITAAAALHEGVVTPTERIDCEGGQYTVANHTYSDYRLGFGVMPFRDVLSNSSNVGTIKVCLRMSPETYFSWITDFGFGGRTGIDLPSEHAGLLTSPAQWSALTQSSMAFGQEIGTTPLQLATAVSAIANGGLLVRPFLLREVRDRNGNRVPTIRTRDGEVIDVGKPHVWRRVLNETVAREVTEMMEYVVSSGTGKTAQIPGYRIAGKTSTAQKIDLATGRYTKYVAAFIGFLPASDPRILILVVVDEPQRRLGHAGSQAAAPAFVEVAEAAIRVLRLAPDAVRERNFWITGRKSTEITGRKSTEPVPTDRVSPLP